MSAQYKNTETTEMYYIDEGETGHGESEKQGLLFMLCGIVFTVALFSSWFMFSSAAESEPMVEDQAVTEQQ